MGDPKRPRHTFFDRAVLGRLAQARRRTTCFLNQVEQIVEEHANDGDPDQRNIDDPDPVRDDVGRLAGQHMHGADGESAARSQVAFAAGGGQIVRVDVGLGIAGRQDVMHTVTARTVCNLLYSAARSQPMKTVFVGGNLAGVQAVLLAQPYVGVAGPANADRNIGCRYR